MLFTREFRTIKPSSERLKREENCSIKVSGSSMVTVLPLNSFVWVWNDSSEAGSSDSRIGSLAMADTEKSGRSFAD